MASAKFKSVNRKDGYVWLAIDYTFRGNTRRIYLHRQAKIGGRIRPGQKIRGLHDDQCATHRGFDCNCASAVFRESE